MGQNYSGYKGHTGAMKNVLSTEVSFIQGLKYMKVLAPDRNKCPLQRGVLYLECPLKEVVSFIERCPSIGPSSFRGKWSYCAPTR